GGATYQGPVEVRTDRSQALAIRWLISSSRGRSENTMEERLSGELLDASNNRGVAVKRREDTHRMADANKAFSHYRWEVGREGATGVLVMARTTPLERYRNIGIMARSDDGETTASRPGVYY